MNEWTFKKPHFALTQSVTFLASSTLRLGQVLVLGQTAEATHHLLRLYRKIIAYLIPLGLVLLSYITMMTQISRKPYRDVSFAIEIPNENFCIQVKFSNNYYYYQSYKNFAVTIVQNFFMFILYSFFDTDLTHVRRLLLLCIASNIAEVRVSFKMSPFGSWNESKRVSSNQSS